MPILLTKFDVEVFRKTDIFAIILGNIINLLTI
jgi:hypothetical protein